ncbi:ABC transporter permease [Actinokineospora soli]|uniref:ABC transporter permease n=1 Tax=Actinokineospora soli TaxID=1048753 RepID=A0ABW2TVN7_9PSEU
MSERRPAALVAAVALLGGLVAAVLGLLTFGAQASARPDGLPLAVAGPEPVAQRIAAQGGDAVAWRVATPQEARELLLDKEVYGVLELGQPAKVVVSGAVNPTGAQAAQAVLTAGAQAAGVPFTVETLHPAGAAGRTAPLAASALLWVGGLASAAALFLLARREGVEVRPAHRFGLVAGIAVVATAVVAGLFALWDSTLPLGWEVLGFLLLTGVAFAAVQGALVRFMGIRAMAVLGPLYLIAPAVAGSVPELLDPVYRALLWSWTPFRFSAEGLRSLLQGTPDAPDVLLGVGVLGGLAVLGLAALAVPERAPERELIPAGSSA